MCRRCKSVGFLPLNYASLELSWLQSLDLKFRLFFLDRLSLVVSAQFGADIEVFLLSGVELLSDLVKLARVPGRVVFLHVLQDLALVFRNARWSSDAKNMTLVFGRHLLLFASLCKQYLALMHEVVNALTHASMV